LLSSQVSTSPPLNIDSDECTFVVNVDASATFKPSAGSFEYTLKQLGFKDMQETVEATIHSTWVATIEQPGFTTPQKQPTLREQERLRIAPPKL